MSVAAHSIVQKGNDGKRRTNQVEHVTLQQSIFLHHVGDQQIEYAQEIAI